MVYQVAFFICWTLAGVSNAFLDWFGFDNNTDEWENKYKKPMRASPQNFYYKITGLPFVERFPLSGTILVFLTDRFHLAQFSQTAFIIAAFSIAHAGIPFYWAFPIQCIIFWGITTHIAQIMVRRHYTK